MIFATIIGGIGTIEGPILGTIIFFALQKSLAQYGTWYFIVLGLVAMAVALWAPRGIWGLISERFGIRLFPVGYHLWPAGEQRPRGLAALRRRSSGTAPAGPAEASRGPGDGPGPPPG
jgi:branched-chain amino acid transport system permease protein